MVADADNDFETLRRQFVAERHVWEIAAGELEEQLDRLMRGAGIPCHVTARAKDVPNLVRKGMKKNRSDLAEFGDRVGGRVTVVHPADVQPAIEAVLAYGWFDEASVDEVKSHDPDRFGYLGTHLACLLPGDAIAPHTPEDVAGTLLCEVQVHTEMQTLWANTSHPLTYKGPGKLPPAAERSIYQLAALSEIYDDLLARARHEIVTAPGYEVAALVGELERHFLSLTAHDFDQELSEEVLGAVLPAFEDDPSVLLREVESLVAEKADQLRWTYEHYASADIFLLGQPESLAVFAGLENRLHGLVDAWSTLPRGWLEELAAAWRVSLPVTL